MSDPRSAMRWAGIICLQTFLLFIPSNLIQIPHRPLRRDGDGAWKV